MKCKVISTNNEELRTLIEERGQKEGLTQYLEGDNNPNLISNKAKEFFKDTSTTVRGALSKMKTGKGGMLASELSKRDIGDAPINVIPYSEYLKTHKPLEMKNNSMPAGAYVSDEGIYLFSDVSYSKNIEKLILHEIVHFYTVDYMYADERFAKLMKKVYEYAKEKSDQKHLYGYTNEFEFIADLFTSQSLLADLASIEPMPDKIDGYYTKWSNLFTQLWYAIMNKLGLMKNESMLDQAMAIGSQLIEDVFVMHTAGLEIDTNPNEPVFSAPSDTESPFVNYILKAVNILQSDKAKQVFDKGIKNGWTLDKVLNEIGGFANYKQLFNQEDLGKKVSNLDKNQLALQIAEKFNFGIEMDVAKIPEERNVGNFGQLKLTEGQIVRVKGYDGLWRVIADNGETYNQEDFIPSTSWDLEPVSNQFDPETNPDGLDPLFNVHESYIIIDDNYRNTQIYSNLSARNNQNESKYKAEDGWEYQELDITTPLIEPSIQSHAGFANKKNSIGWVRVWVNKNTEVVEIQEIQSDLFQKGRNKESLVGNVHVNDDFPTIESYLKEIERLLRLPGRSLSEIEIQKELSIIKNSFKKDTSENQFLQLLNKDSNWIKFFIQAIVQDSARKGYKTVLFPRGETAAKIEGHETIADEIKSIDKQLDYERTHPLDYRIIEDTTKGLSTLFVLEYADANNEPEYEFFKTKEEAEEAANSMENPRIKLLENKKAQLKSQGIEKLKPIEGFYEVRIKNTLEKIYGKENIKQITDEYGNSWLHLDIRDEFKDVIYLQAQPTALPIRGNEALYKHYNLLNNKGTLKIINPDSEKTKKWVKTLNLSTRYRFNVKQVGDGKWAILITPKSFDSRGQGQMLQTETRSEDMPIESLDNKILGFLERLGIKVKSVNEISAKNKDGSDMSAIAVAKIMQRVVEIVEDKRKADTLGEEAAHFLIELFGDNPLVAEMMKDIVNYQVYQDTLVQYSGIEGYDETRIRKEACGRLIAEMLVNKELGQQVPQKMMSLWDRFWNFIVSKFKRISSGEISSTVSAFEIAAEKILNQDISGLSFDNIDRDLEYYELSDEAKAKREELISKLSVEHIRADKKNGGYFKVSDGSKVLKRVSDQVKRYYAYIFKTKDKEDPESIRTRKAGLVIHKLAELIFEKRWNNEHPDIKDIREKAKNDLKELPDFSSETDAYFNSMIHKAIFDSIVKTVDGVIEEINKIESNLAVIHAYTPEDIANNKPAAIPELTIYNPETDTGGTIDLIVIHSNGAVSMFDWKSMLFNMVAGKTSDDVAWHKRLAFDIQLNQYKHILSSSYGADNFAASRVVPINIKFGKSGGLKFIQTIYTNPDDEHLKLIVSNAERTGIEKIDQTLDRLISKRNALAKEFVKNKRNLKLKARLNRLDGVIRSLQVDKDALYVVKQLDSISKFIEERLQEDKDSPNYLSIELLNDLMEFVNLLEGYANNMIDLERSKMIKDPKNEEDRIQNKAIAESINMIAASEGKRQQIIHDIGNKVYDAVLEDTGIDIRRKGFRKSTFLGRTFNRISQFDHPVIRLMNELVKKNYQKTEDKSRKLFKDLEKETEELRQWAELNSMSLMDAFKKLYNKDTGMLYRRVSKEFYDDLGDARKEGRSKWFLDNTEVELFIDDDGIERLKYTGKSKERFDKASKRMLEILKERHKAYSNADERIDEEFKAWRSRFDISYSNMALYDESNFFIKIKSDNRKYDSEEWKYIESNSALKKYYDFYTDIMSELNEMTEVDINENFVANIQQSFVDKMLQTGEYGPGALKEAFLQSMQVHQDDKFRGVMSDIEGDKKIPLMYYSPVRSPLSAKEREAIEESISKRYAKGSVEYEETLESEIRDAEYEKGRQSKSIDLSKSLFMFANSVYSHSAFAATEDLMKLARYEMMSSLQEPESLDSSGKRHLDAFTHNVATKIGVSKEDAEAFDKFMDMYWYGIQGGSTDKIFEFLGRTYSANKLYTNLMRYIAQKAMGLKPILAFGNLAGASANAFFLGSEGRYFTNKQLAAAYKLMASRDLKTRALEELFVPHAHGMTLDRARKLAANKIAGWFTPDQLFVLHRKGDEVVDNSILIAMLQNYGIDSDGKVKKLSSIKDGKSLFDLTVINENNEVTIEGLSDSEYDVFRRKVKTVASKIKGSIPEEDKNLVSTSIFTQSIMMFKNWIPGLAQTRFSGFKRDEYGEFDVGRFSAAFAEFTVEGIAPKLKAFTNLLGEIVFINSGTNPEVSKRLYEKYLNEHMFTKAELSFEEFVELRNAKIKAMGMELRVFLSLLLFVLAIRAALPDDKDDPLRKTAVIGYRLVNRTLLEVSFFLDPRSIWQTTRNIVPQVKLLNDMYLWMNNTFQEGYYDITGIEPKKNEDRTRRFHYTGKMFPVVNSIVDILDLNDTYNPSSAMKY